MDNRRRVAVIAEHDLASLIETGAMTVPLISQEEYEAGRIRAEAQFGGPEGVARAKSEEADRINAKMARDLDRESREVKPYRATMTRRKVGGVLVRVDEPLAPREPEPVGLGATRQQRRAQFRRMAKLKA